MDSSGRRPVFGSIAEGGTISTGGHGSASTEPHDTTELLEGQQVGEYRILGPLGAGGMGRVYSAEHPVIAKKAAIKVLHPELSMNREAVDRFVQEARSVNQIGHPNIVDIFAFGRLPDGRNYFVMEWLRGESLRDRIRRAGLPLPDALAILETITLPLEAAHEKAIVHRDLKPDNVFLVDLRDDRPQVKLLDFGIAKLMGTSGLQRTQTGNLLGTPGYISPEQARAEGVDHRTDIYALGAMAFELVTGELPFAATNAVDMIAHHLFSPPRSASALNPQVPAALDALLAQMLAKQAYERPTLAHVRSEMRALRLQLGGLPTPPQGMAAARSSPHGTQVTPMHLTPSAMPAATPLTTLQTAPKRSRAPLIVIAMLLLACAGVVAFFIASRRDASTKPAEPVETPAVQIEVTESKPAELTETKSVEVKPAETVETKPVAAKPADKRTETKRTETKPVAAKPADTRTNREPKKPSEPTPQGSGSAEKPFDPDAPM
ncbi:MAG: protein kinase [Deltaproteobacteria bacterium]|nr:protein kinase [Deltaproteobacteria bacterium]MDQ3295384.1 protein kinase [Myxococcota bacterium]